MNIIFARDCLDVNVSSPRFSALPRSAAATYAFRQGMMP
jgi:hypothetical protein